MMDKSTPEKQIKKINSTTSCCRKTVGLHTAFDFPGNSYIHAIYFHSD